MLRYTKTSKLSYLGVPFECYSVQTGGRYSLRISIRKNAATGQLDYRVIKGDGRTHRFELYEYNHDATQDQIDEAIERLDSGHYADATPIDRALDTI